MSGVLLVCVAACLWGTVGIATALMSPGSRADPILLGLLRCLLGAMLLLASAWALRLPWPGLHGLPRREIVIFGLSAAAFQLCLFAAFATVGVTVTVAVTVCVPVLLVAMAEALRTRAVPEWGIVLAIGLGAVGVVLAVPGGSASVPTPNGGLVGAALLGGASLAFVALAWATRAISRRVDPVLTAGLGLAAAAVPLLGARMIFAGAEDLPILDGLTARDLWILLYIGLAATGVAYLAFATGLNRCSSAAAGLAATMIEPGVAALLAALVLGERLSPIVLAGCGLMLMAMVLLARVERRRAARFRSGTGLLAP
jgi:DME family drug/metabolite transporter